MWWAIGGTLAGLILCALSFAIGRYIAIRGDRRYEERQRR